MFRRMLSAAALAIATSCAAGNSQAPMPPSAASYHVGSYTAQFTEYALPPGQNAPTDLTVGHDGAVWFLATGVTVDRIISTGAITPFTDSAAPGPPQDRITSGPDGRLWIPSTSIVPGIPDEPNCRQDYLTAVTTGAVFQHEVPAAFCPQFDSHIYGNVAASSDGRLWFAAFPATLRILAGLVAIRADGTQAGAVQLPDFDFALSDLERGPDQALYAALPGRPAPHAIAASIARIDPTRAAITGNFVVPAPVSSIAAGSDGNLWMTLPDANLIIRMTTSGAMTPFPLPLPASRPLAITRGSDGAMWFTESGANAIGRITTSGMITEYPVPTPNAGVNRITSCPHTCENAHGRLWFTETAANRIAKFEF